MFAAKVGRLGRLGHGRRLSAMPMPSPSGRTRFAKALQPAAARRETTPLSAFTLSMRKRRKALGSMSVSELFGHGTARSNSSNGSTETAPEGRALERQSS